MNKNHNKKFYIHILRVFQVYIQENFHKLKQCHKNKYQTKKLKMLKLCLNLKMKLTKSFFNVNNYIVGKKFISHFIFQSYFDKSLKKKIFLFK